MLEVRVPREDVNDDTATVARWLVAAGERVAEGQPVCELETTKTIFEVVAPAAGHLHPAAPEGAELAVGAVLARLTDSPEAPAPAAPSEETTAGEVKATRKAEEFAREHGIDLSTLGKRGIITLEDVQARVAPRRAPHWQPPPGVRRVLVLGAGVAAMQVLDILLNDASVELVGCLDDNPALHGKVLLGVPVLGGMDLMETRRETFDAAVVGIGTNLPVRIRLFERCRSLGIPLANAIDPTARLNRHAVMGEGNVLCSFVHLGVGASLGDNCFLAAHTSVDHHCRLGSHVLLGPGCLLSGSVTVGDDVLFGSGVVVQPTLTVGSRCRVASGSVILRDVPSDHAVKLRPSTDVVPRG